jgi:hypothetical protein
VQGNQAQTNLTLLLAAPDDTAKSTAGFAVGALPTVGPEGSGPSATTAPPATAAPTATVAPTVAPTQAPVATQAPQQQQQQPAPTNPPPPPAQCGYPGSIGVTGGQGNLGGSGGSFTVTSTPVTLSVGGLVNCGQHYRLAYSASGPGGASASGSDCKNDGFSLGLHPSVAVGWTVNVTLQLPPNACG